ncbi:MAG: hypothetical protein WB495_13965 [Xanthobacteraceae bacterium]
MIRIPIRLRKSLRSSPKKGCVKSFSYFDKDNKRITNADVLRRIKSIGIPVWICPSPNGHVQATGLDARGRKQYRYHPKWREIRDPTHSNGSIPNLPPMKSWSSHFSINGLSRSRKRRNRSRLPVNSLADRRCKNPSERCRQ